MVEFGDLNPFELEQVVQLYSSSFLPVETKPIDKVLSMLRQNKNYKLYAAKSNERIIGFALLYIFPELKTGLLDYMAVDPSLRQKGIGKLIFEHALDALQKQIENPIGMLLEVQNERCAQDEIDASIRKSRLRFYQKLGAKKITDHYLLPPQAGSEPEETYLLIVLYKKIDSISRDTLVQYIRAIHLEVYDYQSSDLLVRIAKNLPDKCILSDI